MLKKKLEKLLLDVQKPSRYIGGETGSIIKEKSGIDVRFAFCFPDTYDIGMSHLGMKILYALINSRKNFWCERVFAPSVDFEQIMRENNIPLYGLESLDPIKDFDFIGFTLQYELSYTNILNMLELAGIPVLAKDRGDMISPMVIAGGPCVCNPEPLADFFDLFVLGEGEEVTLELMDLYLKMKNNGASRKEFLKEAVKIEGVYVPAFYEVSYNDDKTIKEVKAIENAPARVKKRIIDDFDKVFYPNEFVVPFTEIVHDRASVEVLRGCIRGCRFCQAGFIYRPFREKSTNTITNQAKSLCESTGYEELSLASLSTSDHSNIDMVLTDLIGYTENEKVNLAFPSMRIDNFSEDLLEKIKKVRKSGLTFAPEAGTQRLRDVINKNITEEEVMNTCRIAFEGGYTNVKLYFMLGLPTETDEDIVGIAELAQKVVDLFYSMENRPKGKSVSVSISTATFVPKPFTPFQFEPQATREMIKHKQQLLVNSIRSKKIRWSTHEPDESILEALLAKGDRRLSNVIYSAWKKGCKFDSWDEHFKFNKWMEAIEENDIDVGFYINRRLSNDEVLAWDHLDYFVLKDFFIKENEKAHKSLTTKNCRQVCSECGIKIHTKKACFDYSNDKIKENKVISNLNLDKVNSQEEMYPVRAVFEKIDRAKYISHLDLNRFMQRVFKRSGLPIWYTEGFNPHAYIMFALALSLGFESNCEIMDFRLTKEVPLDEVKMSLNKVLPEGLKIISVNKPVYKITEIGFAIFEINFNGNGNEISKELHQFMQQPEIIVEKKTKKKGKKNIDIKPHIKIISEDIQENGFKLTIKLPAGTQINYNPTLFLNAFIANSNSQLEISSIKRTHIICHDGKDFL